MYVCMYVCTYVCMYASACMYVGMPVCMVGHYYINYQYNIVFVANIIHFYQSHGHAVTLASTPPLHGHASQGHAMTF